MKLKAWLLEQEQDALDMYALGHITRPELVKRLEQLNYDHYDATAIADEIEPNRKG